MEPFDTFWEAPKNIEKGYTSFGKFYRRNYLRYIPEDKHANILVTSCGPGYFVNLLAKEGYINVTGIDSDPEKLRYALDKGLNCRTENAFPFLERKKDPYDLIFVEQEINHLTKSEVLEFLVLCRNNLKQNGTLILHSLNGANPLTGSESLAMNFDHYNTFTEYSLRQVLEHSHFNHIKIIPLKLYIFYENPLNYVGLFFDAILNVIFRLGFIFYGKHNRIFAKKIAAICTKV